MKRLCLSVLPRSLGALLLLSWLPGTAAGQEDDHEHPGYALRAGDRIEIDLYAAGLEIGVVGGERHIDVNGDVFLPFIGSVNVLGMDQSSLRLKLTELYTEFFDEPILDVEVDLHISVTGAVRTAGSYFLPPTATILDAIAEAGGMAPEITVANLNLPADQSQVRLVRDGMSHVLNLRPDEVVDSILHMPIKSGDWIHVPNQARSRVRDELQFWGGILGFVANITAVILLVGN